MANKKKKRKPEKPLTGRERRIAKAPRWLDLRRGGKPANLLKRYRKEFRLDWECAIAELQELGLEFDEVYLAALRTNISRDFSDEKKHTPIARWEFFGESSLDSDDHFSFIAGYTSGGAAYGDPWNEEENPVRFSQCNRTAVTDEEYYPF